MRLYRVSKHAHSSFTGEGGIYSSGRWHHKGNLIIYTSDSPGNALVEACNGYLNFLKILNKFVCTIIDIPNNVRIDKINIKHLPKGWGDYPHLPETRDLGSKFLEKNENLLLAVPSSIFPEGSYNYIINPRHTDLKRIKVSNLKDFNFRPCPR